ncbi:hypothetical protein B0H12DRAFT_313525 [Mycena haematopus]|nr:hypothetical protein B0H12DRAFT_313525 [Mycena haematopus]
MIPTSFSESSSLGSRGQKRKAKDNELDPVAVYKHIMDRLRQESLFAAHEEDDWNAVIEKMLHDPSLPKPILSRPFTDAHPFYNDLFGAEPETDLHALEDLNPSDPLNPVYDAAATALEQNVLWQGVRDHIIHGNETSCRTAIDMVVLTAVDLAQKQIEENSVVDQQLRATHSLSDRKLGRSNRPPVHSRAVLHQEVSIPDQEMLPSLAFHGIIDYLLAVISAIDARRGNGNDFMMRRVPGTAIDNLRRGLLAILEAKSDSTFLSNKSWAQAATQGAALCVMTGRESTINTLTDGRRWRFARVSKRTRDPEDRKRNKRLSGKAPELRREPKIPPFTTASTQVYNISDHRDLAIVLRLLTISILSAAEDFERLAAGLAP